MFRKQKFVRNFELESLKEKTRILFIDDEERKKTIDYLDKERWRAQWIDDLDSMEKTALKDSHIIFVDIMGVGKKLEKEYEGLDLIVSIKEKYPEKKVVVYSSKSMHDIFHPANEIVDKRILKRAGDFEVFRSAIEELSKKCFNWDSVIEEIFRLIKDELPSGYRKEDLSKVLLKSINKDKSLNEKKIRTMLTVGKTTYDILMPLLSLYLGAK
ncbi:hypothetical protein SAMN05920897_1361 [Alkalispirochaeta americana]|uniref:Response regulator receiver domain-containing protein n=1 Tax=Alkalispirochaeta americana TaxID=159291 RepID=A0A1N6Y136_9SPIO|nr:hypothetical protein [Alkalispirochaeta americana]SIR08189.1 hypothetical protein SAMN05920897_1361 [Alkalispirochaeta americana]